MDLYGIITNRKFDIWNREPHLVTVEVLNAILILLTAPNAYMHKDTHQLMLQINV